MKNTRNLFILIIFLIIISFQTTSQALESLPMKNYQKTFVTEELRLKVPADYKDVWIQAEKSIWEPWLSNQDGFIGRQIFWNKKNQEALILVNWENKKLWKSISMEEVNQIQEKFEEEVKLSLNVNVNPFELIYEGELYKEG